MIELHICMAPAGQPVATPGSLPGCSYTAALQGACTVWVQRVKHNFEGISSLYSHTPGDLLQKLYLIW